MTPTVSIKSLHLEYRLWINELTLYKEEILIFERHLEELVNSYTGENISAEIEKFQNQFICQKEVIDVLKHDLNTSERQLAAFARELSGNALESVKMDNHVRLRERMITFRKLFTELKEDFRRFESEVF
jgi:hypothetical protein